MNEPWMSVPEAATYSARHPKTLLRALRRNELRGVQAKAGGSWRTRATYVDAWLAGEAAPVQKSRAAGRR